MTINGLSAKQAQSIGLSTGRVNVWEGSIRSGKTFSSILRWLTFVATAPVAGELVMIGKNRDSIYRNVFAPIENEPALAFIAEHVSYKQGATTARILGRRVNVIGANDAKAESKIRGMTVAGAYVDELTVLPVEFFKQLLGRMSVAGAQLFATTNPDGPAHWLKADYLDRLGGLPDWRRFHFTIDDNPALSEEYKTSIRREYTGLWYRRFIEGLWVAAEGAIYDMWDPDVHVIPWENLPPLRDMLAIGVDYGTTNPTVALLLGLTDEESPRLALVDEWRYEASDTGARLTDAALSQRMRDWLAGTHTPYVSALRPRWVIVDPSAASFQVQLRADGVQGVVDADNEVLYGIRTVSSLLGGQRLIVTDKCRGFITEAPGYSWDAKATKEGVDKPIKTADHSLDGGRYAIATTERLWRPAIRFAA